MMTRFSLFSTLLTLPLLGAVGLNRRTSDENSAVVLGPGTYTIGPNGSIRLGQNGQVKIEGVTFDACVIEDCSFQSSTDNG
jgi:hypothetical protein